VPGVASNLLNPFFSLVIQNKDGERIPLWLTHDQPDLPPLAVVQEVTIEQKLGQVNTITATLSMPYLDALQFLDEDRISFLRAFLEVSFGYVVGDKGTVLRSPVYGGMLFAPDVAIGPDVTITLNAKGAMDWVSSRAQRSGFYKGTRLEVFKQILEPMKKVINNLEYSGYFLNYNVKSGGPADKLWQEEIVYSPSYKTMWKAAQALAKECQSYIVTVETPQGMEITLLDYDGAIEEKPLHVLWLYPNPHNAETLKWLLTNPKAGIGPASGVYPLLSFNCPTKAMWMPAAVRGIFVQGIKDKDGEVEKKVFGDGKEGQSPPNVTGAAALASTDLNPVDEETGDGMEPAFHDQVTKEVSQGVNSSWRAGLNGNLGSRIEVETIGIPDMKPGLMVRLLGLGKRFDHNYFVDSVTHVLGSGGYTTRVVAYDSGNKWSPADAVEKAKGNVGNEDPEPEDQNSSTAEAKAG